ncbi:MAG: hypothetical protein JWM32_2303 [Verrucomicrobia bacterium]|nr:hypothetical protein [Verrucomicrobiota bacterium]
MARVQPFGMKFLGCLVMLACMLALAVRAAEPERPFTETLTAEQKERLGLAALTPAQQEELNAAINAYTRGAKTAAVEQAVAQVQQRAAEDVQVAQKKAADEAVAEYKKKQEPGVIARTLDVFKRRQEEDKRERFIAHVVGEFRGWQGGTYFPLTDGQLWRQTGTDTYELPPVQNAEVEFYQSKNGYWRMKYNGSWITVKRLQ